MQNLVPSALAVPDFTPVPRKYRFDGWTAERQRAFIAALADTGSVKAACRRINMSPEGAYYLRRQPGADSFRAAWAAALAHGVQNLVDIAMDRAIEGVPVPIFHKGEQVGEKRRFNDRLLMFMMKHHLPAIYDAHPLPRGTRHPETLAREAAENCPVCKARAEDEAAGEMPENGPFCETPDDQRIMESMLAAYVAKLGSERKYRLAGEIVAADFTLRQLTHIELILDAGGESMALIRRCTAALAEPGGSGGGERYTSPISTVLAQIREDVWAKSGEPPRPDLPLDRPTVPCSSFGGGPTYNERERAQRACRQRIAAAQAEWEAAAREDSWAMWKARHA